MQECNMVQLIIQGVKTTKANIDRSFLQLLDELTLLQNIQSLHSKSQLQLHVNVKSAFKFPAITAKLIPRQTKTDTSTNARPTNRF